MLEYKAAPALQFCLWCQEALRNTPETLTQQATTLLCAPSGKNLLMAQSMPPTRCELSDRGQLKLAAPEPLLTALA